MPQPTAEVRDKFSQWIRQVVDPENTLDLIVGKPRILILKQAPQKVQIPDERVRMLVIVVRDKVDLVIEEMNPRIRLLAADEDNVVPLH